MKAINTFDQIGELLTDKKRSSMFGIPCYKVGRKPFIMFYDNEIVCKLIGQAHSEAMILKGATLFNPKRNTKPMENWVRIPFLYSEKWKYFSKIAYEFVKNE